jgi:co-chaperonin GroES (HSP10)
MDIELLRDRVLIEPDKKEDFVDTGNGILLEREVVEAEDAYSRGVIVAVGPRIENKGLVKVGARVLWRTQLQKKVKIGDKMLSMLNEDLIEGVFTEE